MRVPSFDVTLMIEVFVASAARCGKEFAANRTPQKMDKKNRLAIISFLTRRGHPTIEFSGRGDLQQHRIHHLI
jgi:hypothetical protein